MTLPVRDFPIVWKLLLLHDPLHRTGLCPEILCLSFYLYLSSYLISKRLVCLSGIWGPLPVFRSCFVEVALHADDLLVYLWQESGLFILFVCHFGTALFPVFDYCNKTRMTFVYRLSCEYMF